MSVSIDLSANALDRLRAEAVRRGVSIDDVITELAEQLPAPEGVRSPTVPAFVAAGASVSGITPRIDQLLTDGFGRD